MLHSGDLFILYVIVCTCSSSIEDVTGNLIVCVLSHSVVSNSVTPWTVAHQAPLSMGASWKEYWNRLPFPPPENLASWWIAPKIPVSPALAGRFFTTEPPGKPCQFDGDHIKSVDCFGHGGHFNNVNSSKKSMEYLSISLNHFRLPSLMVYSSQHISLSPPCLVYS